MAPRLTYGNKTMRDDETPNEILAKLNAQMTMLQTKVLQQESDIENLQVGLATYSGNTPGISSELPSATTRYQILAWSQATTEGLHWMIDWVRFHA